MNEAEKPDWHRWSDTPCLVERNGKRVRVTVEDLTAEEVRVVGSDTIVLNELASYAERRDGLVAGSLRGSTRCHAEFAEAMGAMAAVEGTPRPYVRVGSLSPLQAAVMARRLKEEMPDKPSPGFVRLMKRDKLAS